MKHPAKPCIQLDELEASLSAEDTAVRVSHEATLLPWQEKVMLCKSADPKNKFDCLVRYLDAAIEYRRLHGSNKKEAEKFKGAAVVVTTGTDILQMSFAMTPRDPFGVVALYLMGLTVSSIQQMTQDEKVAFVTLVSASLGNGSINRLVPARLADVVDVIVEIQLPLLE